MFEGAGLCGGPVEMVMSGALETFLTPHHGVEEDLRAVIEPVVAAEGLELIVLQLVRSASRDLLRLSVDRPGAGVTPGKGVTIAELERTNRVLGDLLDVEDAEKKLFKEHWELEVGSPGVDRPLTKRSHFALVIGQKIKARHKGERKSYVGVLDTADDDGITIAGTRIAFGDLDSAHVIYQFAAPSASRGNAKKKPATTTKKAKKKKTDSEDNPDRV